MFNGITEVPLAGPQADVDFDKESTDSRGCVLALDMDEVQQVVIDLSALLAIAKHSRNGTTAHGVKGELCGLQLGSTVEVTLAVPQLLAFTDVRRLALARPADEWERQRLQRDKADMDVKRAHSDCFRKSMAQEQFDTYAVGQYIGASLCSHALRDMEDTLWCLFEKVLLVSPGVLLVFDPIGTGVLGKLSVTAHTFTKEFLAYAKSKSDKRDAGGVWNVFQGGERLVRDFASCKITANGILREVPIQVRVSPLHKMTLHHYETIEAPSTSTIATSRVLEQYMEDLLGKAQQNCDALRGVIQRQRRDDSKDRYVNDESRAEELVLIDFLKRQTAQLIGLCDSVLLSAAAADSV